MKKHKSTKYEKSIMSLIHQIANTQLSEQLAELSRANKQKIKQRSKK
ncbi:hypothetical protein [Campylobacter blaseri]|nr:hypothetical protein [Campylobacter blaseri]